MNAKHRKHERAIEKAVRDYCEAFDIDVVSAHWVALIGGPRKSGASDAGNVITVWPEAQPEYITTGLIHTALGPQEDVEEEE